MTLKEIKKKLTLRKFLTLFDREHLKRYYHKIVHFNESPRKIAMSLAVGMFIGLAVPLGLQTILIIPVCLLFSTNLLLTLAISFISNPLTIIPIYVAAFSIGEFITGNTNSWNNFNFLVENPGLDAFMKLGMDGFLVYFSGSIPLGLIAAIITFFITAYLVKSYRKKHNIPVNGTKDFN